MSWFRRSSEQYPSREGISDPDRAIELLSSNEEIINSAIQLVALLEWPPAPQYLKDVDNARERLKKSLLSKGVQFQTDGDVDLFAKAITHE